MAEDPGGGGPTERRLEDGGSNGGRYASDPFLEKVKPIARKTWRALTSGGWKWATFKLAGVVLVLSGTVLKLIVLPAVLSQGVTTWAEGQGVDMAVGSWSADLLDLTVTAHQVDLFAPGAYDQKELLSTEAVDFDLSLWSGVFGDGWLSEVRVREPNLYLERLLSGRWNWQELADVHLPSEVVAALPPAASGSGMILASAGPREAATGGPNRGAAVPAPDFSVPRLLIEDMALQWVENLPADSGGGLVQALRATLHLDDVTVTATDLRGLADLRPTLAGLSLEARTGDGRISFTGDANLFSWTQPPPPQEGNAFAAFDGPVWRPILKSTLYLENVGAAAFARLTPDASILPVRGSMTGTVVLAVASGQVECAAELKLQDVAFAVNEKSPLVNERLRSQVSPQLADYRANGLHRFPCGGLLGPLEAGDGSAAYRPFQAFQTNVVRAGLAEAPRQVRALAAIEHARYSEEPIEPELRGEANRIAGSVDSEVLQWMHLANDIQRAAPRRTLDLPGSSPAAGGVLGRIPRLGGGMRRP